MMNWLDRHLSGTILGMVVGLIVVTLYFPFALAQRLRGRNVDPESFGFGLIGLTVLCFIAVAVYLALHLRWSA